ncbi:hypothetical protein EGR_02213 [Echinococcus granulosus]|uniref:Tyrosine-protein kinase ephrin type A/B receptor-like domain-containing protein n=1 Tax=Echinococcus granulosus TaxID=6210 RepID=W6UWC4_ECHGR|nr:hypothetical protein EGR_02213 [Echinococcus granulosus]EUB62772.1 hypothetical protein EGR_02213 [Echinococcus granulosus]
MRFSLIFLVALLYDFNAEPAKGSRFTVWLPCGRLIHLPCNLNGHKFIQLSTRVSNVSSSDLVKAELLNNVELGVATVWYNNIGRVIHVGGILPIHLPMIAPGEMDYELSRTASTYETQSARTTLELPKAYAIDLGSSLDTLHRKAMTTVTCRTYRSQRAGLLKSELLEEEPFSMKEELIYNQYSLMHYVQPLVLWKYVIPEHPLIKEHFDSDWWRAEAEVFCHIICPTGTQLKHPPPPLLPISFNYPMNTSLQSVDKSLISPAESAYVLATVSLSCEACPPGHAPRTPYSFAPCTPCPRGLYRGDTGWPSASGCLHCPAGFTTLREGSTSRDDCVIDGGMLTRAIVGFAVWAYHNFMELIVAAHEASMSYTKRARLYLSEESKADMSKESVHWINRIKPAALAVGIFYSLLVLLLVALALYRLLLIYRFKRTHSKHMHLLRKSIVIGQLNSQDDTKDLLRKDFAKEELISCTCPMTHHMITLLSEASSSAHLSFSFPPRLLHSQYSQRPQANQQRQPLQRQRRLTRSPLQP